MGYAVSLKAACLRPRRLALLGALAILALFGFVASASASEPPTLKKLTISPSSVNTTSTPQSVAVTAEISSTPGFSQGSVQFESPTGSEHTERVSLSKISGTAESGTWEASVPFNRYIASGTWRISTLDLEDKEGNRIRLSSTQLAEKSFAHTVSVTSTEDNEPPALVGLSFSSTTINTTASAQTLTVTAHITDNLSGFTNGSITFRSPSAKRFTETATFTKLSGTATDGMYEAKVTFKRYIEPGPWKVSAVRLEDAVENEIILNNRHLQSKGLPETVHVESIEDEAPPSLAGLSISPPSVSVLASSQTVAVTAHVTDDLSGVASADITFESPNGKQATARAGFTLVSGTATNGTYEAIVTFEPFIQTGTWKVRTIHLTDNVGNEAVLSSTQLEAKGFPDSVTVTSVEDSTAPALASFAISPSSVNVTSASETVTVTAEITDAQSGFSHGSVVFESPNGKVITNDASFSRVSGNASDGIYEAKVKFKPFVQSGTWKVSNVNLVDAVNNEANFSSSQLEGKSFPTTVSVTSNEDTEPPVLTGLTMTPATINTATSSQLVIVTATITDNLAGFDTGFIQFESENGKHKTNQAAFATKLSGTETSGTWEAVVNFRESLESGTWKVNSLTLADNAGNQTSLSAAQLESKAFPSSVFDETGAPPTIRKLSPRKGPAAGGTSVKIKGTNFINVSAVKFGSKEAVGFTVTSLDTLTAIAPDGTTGTVDVTVTTTNGTSAISSHDRFRYEAPTITEVSPNHGPKAGGTEVIVTGTGFEPGTSGTKFQFGSTMASSVSCSSRTSCTVFSPAGTKVGSVNVRAIVSGKRSAKTAADLFSYT